MRLAGRAWESDGKSMTDPAGHREKRMVLNWEVEAAA
jgi:hypothetical protein